MTQHTNERLHSKCKGKCNWFLSVGFSNMKDEDLAKEEHESFG